MLSYNCSAKWASGKHPDRDSVHMTKNRLMVAFDSNKGPNLKVVKQMVLKKANWTYFDAYL